MSVIAGVTAVPELRAAAAFTGVVEYDATARVVDAKTINRVRVLERSTVPGVRVVRLHTHRLWRKSRLALQGLLCEASAWERQRWLCFRIHSVLILAKAGIHPLCCAASTLCLPFTHPTFTRTHTAPHQPRRTTACSFGLDRFWNILLLLTSAPLASSRRPIASGTLCDAHGLPLSAIRRDQ